MLRNVETTDAYSSAVELPSMRSWLVAIRVRTTQSGLVTTSVSPPAAAAAEQCTMAELVGNPLDCASFAFAAS